ALLVGDGQRHKALIESAGDRLAVDRDFDDRVHVLLVPETGERLAAAALRNCRQRDRGAERKHRSQGRKPGISCKHLFGDLARAAVMSVADEIHDLALLGGVGGGHGGLADRKNPPRLGGGFGWLLWLLWVRRIKGQIDSK